MSLKRFSTHFLCQFHRNLKPSSGVERTRVLATFIRHDSNYKAAVLQEFNKPLEIKEVKAPKKLKKGEVRIKVHACALNASDYLLIQGTNPSGCSLPITPGFEFTGEVIEANECENFGKGDKVIALNKDKLGGLAEQCVVNEQDVWSLPPSLSYKAGAALVDSFGTALLGLSRHAHVLEKQIVLVTMAPAHGFAPLDIAANVYKTKVIAVAMTEKETDLLRERGAWSALAYNEKNLLSTVKKLTEGKGVDIVYDTMAGDVLKSGLKCISHEGHIIVAGVTLNELPQMKIAELLSLPSFSLTGVSLRSYRKHASQTYRQTVSDVLEMSEQHLIKPEIAQVFSLSEVNKAIEKIKEEQPIGKIIIEIKKK